MMLKLLIQVARRLKIAWGVDAKTKRMLQSNDSIYKQYSSTVHILCVQFLGEDYGGKSVERVFDRIAKDQRIFELKEAFHFYMAAIIIEEVLVTAKKLFEVNGELPDKSWFALHPELWSDGNFHLQRDKLMAELTLEKICLN